MLYGHCKQCKKNYSMANGDDPFPTSCSECGGVVVVDGASSRAPWADSIESLEFKFDNLLEQLEELGNAYNAHLLEHHKEKN